MATVADLVTEIQGVVDVDPALALTALNRRYRRMVVESRCLRKRVTVATLTAGTAFYSVTGLAHVYEVFVDGVPYGKARRDDVYAASQGELVWSGPGGLVVEDASSAGARGFTVIPTPTESGGVLSAYAAAEPDVLLTSTNLTALAVESDYFDDLVNAAASTILRRQGEGDPDTLDARFEQATETLRRRTEQRFRSGVQQIRVVGINV